MEPQKVIDSIDHLYSDIDRCIADIISSRINKDKDAEGRALFKAESLLVGSMQELSFLRDFIVEHIAKQEL